jgi:predicted ArsR family transcriptional regulator
MGQATSPTTAPRAKIRELLQAMRRHGSALTLQEMSDKLRITRDALDWRLTNLEAECLVRRAGYRGKAQTWIAGAPQSLQELAAVETAKRRLQAQRDAVLTAKRAQRAIERRMLSRQPPPLSRVAKGPAKGDYTPRRDPLIAAFFGGSV